jgi:hypothetical protein
MYHVVKPEAVDRLCFVDSMPETKLNLKHAKYAKYVQYVPMFSAPSKEIECLFAIGKVWLGSVDATQMPDCAVQQDIIVISTHRPILVSTVRLGFGCGGRAEILVIFRWPTGNMQNMVNMINI